jgi:F-type H+-transporting ATPase subunit gamma
MKEIVSRLVQNASDDHKLLREPESRDDVLFIIIGSDRGLCGAFNNNLFKVIGKKIEEDYAQQKANGSLSLVCIGRKAIKHFGKRNYNIIAEYPNFFEDVKFADASAMMKWVIKEYTSGQYDEVKLAYNEFKSVIAQERIIEPVLPIDPESLVDEEICDQPEREYIYEPDVDSILKKLLPSHLNLQLWKAILESNAAEQGARMTAMDNATENANELQEDLELEYNRARQSAITTEISEIISGAQALENA